MGGWQLARAALIAADKLTAQQGDVEFYEAKIKTARFFAEHFMVQAQGLKTSILLGSVGTLALTEDQF